MNISRIDALICSQEKLSVLTREALEEIQLKKLNLLLKRVGERNGFYSGLPRSVSHLDELKSLPFTTEADLEKQASAFLTCSQGNVQRVITERTSGTTGNPKRVFYTHEDCENTIALYMAGLGELIYPGCRTMICMPFSGPYGLGELISEAIIRLGATPIKTGIGKSYGELLAQLEQHRADTYVGMPGPLLSLLRFCGRNQLHRALVSADACPDAILSGIESILGEKVYPHYGSREMGMAGAICCSAHEGMHLREHMILAEIIDEKDNALPLGAYGQLVLTGIGMDAMPLIRYKTGDYTRFLPEQCPCGSVVRRIDWVQRGKCERSITAYDQLVFSNDYIVDYRLAYDGTGYQVEALTLDEQDCTSFFYEIFGKNSRVAQRPVQMTDAPLYPGKRTILPLRTKENRE